MMAHCAERDLSRIVFFKRLAALPLNDRFDQFMRFRLAPVVDGIKPAELVSLCPLPHRMYEIWKKRGNKFVASLGLESCILRERNGCACVLIFRRDSLSTAVSGLEERRLLSVFGYPENTGEMVPRRLLDRDIALLKTRFNGPFPHEIGLFLGIPLADVEGFIVHAGENYLFQGYWKVYSNPEDAKSLFFRFDKSRNDVIGICG